MELINTTKKQNVKRPLKRAKTGFETEFHVIDKEGKISYEGYGLIDKVLKKYPEVTITKECGMNIVELGCYPDINTYNPALEIIESIEKLIIVAKENGLRIYPFSTYPGKIEPRFTPDESGKYGIQKRLFGEEKFGLATKVVGFHHHYTLPKSVFDEEKKKLRLLIDSKLKRSLMNSYNFEIAIDPILTLLTQSSPFFEGKLLAKNSRMLVYRGGKKLGYPGLYSKVQQLGGLPPYKQTETDLINSIRLRRQRWRMLIRRADPNADFEKLYPYNLDISWNPVKINKHGTLEQRGMDINYMSIIIGVSTLIKFCLKKIQRDFIEVIPADLGITDSFKISNNIMYIPPQTYVRQTLQRASAYEGFENEELYQYTKRFFKLAKSLTPKFYNPLIKHIEKMIVTRKTTSDRIMIYSKKFMRKGNTISEKNAQKIAIHFANKFEIDLKKTKDIIEKIAEKHKSLIENY